MDFIRNTHHYEQQIQLGCGVEVLRVFPDQSALGISDSGALQLDGVAAVRLLQILVDVDAPLLSHGLCRILDEERQVVGISDPPADDRADRHVLRGLFFGLSLLYAAVHSSFLILRVRDDFLSRRHI